MEDEAKKTQGGSDETAEYKMCVWVQKVNPPMMILV